MTDNARYSSIRDYLRVLRSQRWVIVTVILITAGVAVFLSLRQQPEYEAISAISFEQEAADLGVIGSGAVSNITPPEQTPQARTQTIEEPSTVRRVRERLGLELPVTALQNAIVTSLDQESYLVDVTARWGDAAFAARLANAFAEEASAKINSEAKRGFKAQLDDIEDQIDDLGNSVADQTEAAVLIQQKTRLRYLSETAEPANVVRTAQAPEDQVSPQPVRNAVFGLIVGLAIGLLAAFLRDSLDRRLRGVREVQDELHFPLVGHVRQEVMGKVVKANGTIDEKLQDDLEAIRILRQNLEFLDVDSPLRLILITSALPGEGKSTVASSLAFATAAFGGSTLLVECDLRRPSLAERLGLNPSPGLTDYLSRRAGPRDILQTVEVGASHLAPVNGSDPAAEPVRPLVCITAGTTSFQPAELLESDRLREFMGSVARAYDTVIIDTSPLLPVADTLGLLPLVDCVLLCVRSGQTTRDQVQAARAALDRFPKRPTGLVVTGLKKRDAAEYGYYSYGEAYRRAPTQAFAGVTHPEAFAPPVLAPPGTVAEPQAGGEVVGGEPVQVAQTRDGAEMQPPAEPTADGPAQAASAAAEAPAPNADQSGVGDPPPARD